MAEALRVEMWLGDCLDVMPKLSTNASLVFCDLPYGVTQNKWDSAISMSLVWPLVKEKAKQSAAYIFTATQPFASTVIWSNKTCFRYDLIWQKTNITGFFRAKYAPLRDHETLLVFYEKKTTYNPQMTPVGPTNSYRPKTIYKTTSRSSNYGGYGTQPHRQDNGMRYPRSVIRIQGEQRQRSLHPTQKPVALLEWLIKTYTNPGDTVLDPCAGSFTTSVAALKTGRNSICIEKDKTYFAAGVERVKAEIAASGVNADLVVHG